MKSAIALLVAFLTVAPLAGQKSAKTYAIYFVPIGNAPTSEINDLVTHYQQKFRLESTVLPALTPGSSEVDPNRRQLIAENLVDLMYKNYARYVQSGSSILIGVTSDDMYPLGQRWQFCFGWRKRELRSAVVSTARMNLHYEGEPPGQANEISRLQKVVTKDIGITYYRLPQSKNPRSVLFSGILGIQELDRVSENF